jgi:hypothetical protein
MTLQFEEHKISLEHPSLAQLKFLRWERLSDPGQVNSVSD